jgi:hypothetical protein
MQNRFTIYLGCNPIFDPKTEPGCLRHLHNCVDFATKNYFITISLFALQMTSAYD